MGNRSYLWDPKIIFGYGLRMYASIRTQKALWSRLAKSVWVGPKGWIDGWRSEKVLNIKKFLSASESSSIET